MTTATYDLDRVLYHNLYGFLDDFQQLASDHDADLDTQTMINDLMNIVDQLRDDNGQIAYTYLVGLLSRWAYAGDDFLQQIKTRHQQ